MGPMGRASGLGSRVWGGVHASFKRGLKGLSRFAGVLQGSKDLSPKTAQKPPIYKSQFYTHVNP